MTAKKKTTTKQQSSAAEEEARLPEPPSAEAHLFERLLWVQKHLPTFVQDVTVRGGGANYKATSHDQVVARAKPLLVRAGVLVLSEVLSHEHEWRKVVTNNGERSWHWHEVVVGVRFVNAYVPAQAYPPLDQPPMKAVGCALDTQDKGAGKAVSYAKKYGLLLALLGQTGDFEEERVDGEDAGPYERESRPKSRSTGKRRSNGQQSEKAPMPTLNIEPLESTAHIDGAAWSEVVSLWHDNGVINEQQRRALFKAATDAGWKGQEVLDVIHHHLGVSSKALPWGKPFDKLCELFVAYAPPRESEDEAPPQGAEEQPGELFDD